MARPNPVLIFPDDVLIGRSIVESVTSEAGPYVGPVTVGSANDGDLLPNVYANEVTGDYATDYGMVRAGGPYRTAEWRWKPTADASDAWRGVDQIGWSSNPHDPFAATSGYRNVQACCYAKRLGTIFCYWVTGSGTVLVRYRSAGGDPTTWTLASFTFERPVVSISQGGMSVFELPDGTLRMLVVGGHTGTPDNDVDVYSSTDGLAWSLASRNVVEQAGTGALQIMNIKAAASGDWIRLLVFVAGTTYNLVSSDRGASFGMLSSLSVAIPSNTQTADAYSLCDIVGLDDYAGTFLMFYNDRSVGVDDVSVRIASRDEDFSIPSNWSAFALGAKVWRICAAKTATHVFAYTVEWDGTAGGQREIGCLFADRNVAANTANSDWRHFILASSYNSAKSMPRSLASCEVDGGLMLMFGRCDPDTSGAEEEYGGAVYVQQWTARSAWEDENITGSATEPLSVWDTMLGDIVDWASTSWRSSTGAGASRTWASNHTMLVSNGSAVAGAVESTYAPGSSARWADGQNLVAEWVLSTPAPGSSGQNDRIAVRIKGIGTTAGVSVDFSVRHLDGSTVSVYDNGAGSPIATLSGLSLSSYFYIGRAAISVHDSATWAEVAYARVDQMGSAWSTATGTLNLAAAGVTAQLVKWGHLAAAVGLSGVTSYWRRFGFDHLHDWHQAGFANPDSLRGAPVSARPWYTNAGAWTQFSGGAGFEFDTWQNESRHRNEVENLFLPSPQATWRSTSLASNQIVFDSRNAGRSVFDHGAVALFGTNTRSVRIAYNAGNSWSAPSANYTAYSDLVSGLTVSAVEASMRHVDVAGATLAEGEYVGKWLHATSGPWASASITITNQVGNRLFFGEAGWTAVAMQTGDSVVIHGDRFGLFHDVQQRYRYMLVETSGQTTASGYYQIGTIIAGLTLGFDGAAVDWEHSETMVNGTDVSDGIGGVRWGFEATPPRREWRGRVAGDAIKVRRSFSQVLRAFASMSVRPFAMTWDRSVSPVGLALVRYIGDFEFQNAGWRQAADGSWYSVGDAELTFSEEL